MPSSARKKKSHGALSPCAIVRRALRLPPLVAGLLLANQMNLAILDLAAALHERLAIISDDSSLSDSEATTIYTLSLHDALPIFDTKHLAAADALELARLQKA